MGGCLRGLWENLHSCKAGERRCQEDEECCVGRLGEHASLAGHGNSLGSGFFHDEKWKVASYWEGRRLILDECRIKRVVA